MMLSNWLAIHLFLTSTLFIFVGIYSFLRRRGLQLATPFSIAMFLCSLFTLVCGLDVLAVNLQAKLALLQIKSSILPFIPISILVAATFQARRSGWFSARRLWFLLLIPLLNLAVLWLPTLSPYFRHNFQLNLNGFLPVLTFENGPWFWIILLYATIICIGIFGIEFNILLNSYGLYRKRMLLMGIGQFIPAAALILFNSGNLDFFNSYNYPPHTLFITVLLNGWAIYRYQWLLTYPITRDITLDQINEMLLVVDHNHKILDLNRAAHAALELSDNTIGTSVEKIIKEWGLYRAEAHDKGLFLREIKIQKNNSVNIYELTINPIKLENDQPASDVIILREITKYRQQQEQIHQLALAVEQSPNSVVITDTDGIIQYINPSFTRLTGYSSKEVIGQKTSLLKSDKTPAAVYAEMWSTIKAGKIWKSDLLNRRKNGEFYWEETLITPLFDAEGQVINYISIKEDITARKEINTLLHRRLDELDMINTISMAAATQLDLTTLVSLVGQQLEQFFNARSVFVALHNRATGFIEVPYWTIDRKRVVPPPLKFGEGLVSHILKTGKHLLISSNFVKQAIPLGHKAVFVNDYGYPKTWLGVPIMSGKQALGVISLQNYQMENAFSENDVRLLTTIAANVGIAVENAHLFQSAQQEIQERIHAEQEVRQHADQLAVLYETSHAVTAGLNLELVLNTLLEKCKQIAQMDVFSVGLYEENEKRINFIKFYDKGRELPHITFYLSSNSSLTQNVIQKGQSIFVPDLLHPAAQEQYDAYHTTTEHARCYLGIPLMRGEQVIGVMSVQSYEPNNYSKEQIQTLEIIASQATSAIENARLYEETRHRAEEMTLLYEISLQLSTNLDLNHVLRNLLDKCKQILPMDTFYVALYDESKHTIYHPLFFDNGEFKTIATRDIRLSPGLAGEIITQGKSLYLPNTTNPEIARKYQIIHIGGNPTRCYVGIPMIVRDKVMGVISMQTYEPNSYTPEQIRLIETIATQAAIAIENSQLYEAAQKEIHERRKDQEILEHTNQELQIQLTRVESLQGELREQAIRDALTGLYNRRYLDEIFGEKINRMRKKASSLSVMMLDIDHFKVFNDTHGHKTGDDLLQMLGKLLRQYTRNSDVACRYGGEEFVILLADTNLEIAQKRANEIRLAFASQGVLSPGKEKPDGATISIGISVYPTHGDCAEALLIQADQALYVAKAAGRNQVVAWKQ